MPGWLRQRLQKNYSMNEKLTKAELTRYKTKYCKGCGTRIPFPTGHRLYCLKCRKVYPSDNQG